MRFNEKRHEFDAWPIATIPGTTTSFSKSWLIAVKVAGINDSLEFPSIGDQFTVDMVTTVKRDGGEYTLTHLLSERIANPYEDISEVASDVRKAAVFKVEVPRS